MLTLGLDNKPVLSYETFSKLREFVYARCGISLGDAKKYFLESRLMHRLEERGLKSFDEYYYFLMYDTDRGKEVSSMISVVVTNETSFFRDPNQLNGFRKAVVPRILDVKKNGAAKKICIWSSACSTGEEPYTLAMLLMEDSLHLTGWGIEIIGSDISDNVLKSAAAAAYDRYSVRNAPPDCLNKYFVNTGERYTVKKQVQDMVKYRKINLLEPLDTRMVREMDAVFCRNVLIYFDDAAKKKVVGHLYDSLVRGGYLVLGFSESIHNITRLFRPVNINGTLVYQKM